MGKSGQVRFLLGILRRSECKTGVCGFWCWMCTKEDRRAVRKIKRWWDYSIRKPRVSALPMGPSLAPRILSGTSHVKLSCLGSEATPLQAPDALWERSWRASAPQCMPKLLLILFGSIRYRQNKVRYIRAPSRKSETSPGCWCGGSWSSDPLTSWV